MQFSSSGPERGIGGESKEHGKQKQKKPEREVVSGVRQV